MVAFKALFKIIEGVQGYLLVKSTSTVIDTIISQEINPKCVLQHNYSSLTRHYKVLAGLLIGNIALQLLISFFCYGTMVSTLTDVYGDQYTKW